ncbi:hypothetical protein [Arsenicibacter rosenii]|uniref:Uncharacterized protein n=1 Tax=Arsenicibacter rosenii TaxID=1750698 RepID=A0A1S2VLS5_9BACT|nr:hypothetical protein [Arsenicibacter rosenii]OIN59727.1 hypothetical protein BLX24_07650 [Arsenicibacter rosenii]
MLKQKELQNIIDQFPEERLKEKAFFGIYHYGNNTDESFIKANTEGLQLFALQLLRSTLDIDLTSSTANQNTISLIYDEDWIDEHSDTLIQYIHPVFEKPVPKIIKKNSPYFSGKLVGLAFSLFALLVVVALLIGFVTILKWLLW